MTKIGHLVGESKVSKWQARPMIEACPHASHLNMCHMHHIHMRRGRASVTQICLSFWHCWYLKDAAKLKYVVLRAVTQTLKAFDWRSLNLVTFLRSLKWEISLQDRVYRMRSLCGSNTFFFLWFLPLVFSKVENQKSCRAIRGNCTPEIQEILAYTSWPFHT